MGDGAQPHGGISRAYSTTSSTGTVNSSLLGAADPSPQAMLVTQDPTQTRPKPAARLVSAGAAPARMPRLDLGIAALRARWRLTFGRSCSPGADQALCEHNKKLVIGAEFERARGTGPLPPAPALRSWGVGRGLMQAKNPMGQLWSPQRVKRLWTVFQLL
jgi:hypothetical protein